MALAEHPLRRLHGMAALGLRQAGPGRAVHVRVGRRPGRSGRRSRHASRCAAPPRPRGQCATIANRAETEASAGIDPHRAAPSSAPALPQHQMRPNQCAAAILTTRVSGAISAGFAQHVAARPLQRPQIGLDQGQRKEGRTRLSRQIRHMLPARDKASAGSRRASPQASWQRRARRRRQAAPTAPRRQPRGATAAAAAARATASRGRPSSSRARP